MVNINTFKSLLSIKKASGNFVTNPVQNLNFKGLKYCPESIKDTFVRTIPQKKSVQLIDDIAEKLNITPDNFETLPLQLYRDIQKSGKNFVRTDAIKELVQKTGLSEAQIAQEMDNIATMITLLKPSDFNFEASHKIFDVMIGTTRAKVSYISHGMSGSIYKIEIPGAKPVALKNYFGDMHPIKNNEGAYAEAAIQKKLYEDGVCDTAALLCANPDRGWILSEFIDSNYKMRTSGIKVREYLQKNRLIFDDVNKGMNIKDANGNDILVDFGYIIPESTQIRDFNFVIRDINAAIKEEKQSIDYDKLLKLYNENPKERFKIIHDLQNCYDGDFDRELYKAFYESTKNTPQMRLYNNYSEYILTKGITNDSIMTASKRAKKLKSAQTAFNECGFRGNVENFAGSQKDFNPLATFFNDFTAAIHKKLFSIT